MAYELREGSGSLFFNSRKTTDKHADYTGRALINGVECYLDAWVKPGKDGRGEWFSLAIKPIDGAKAAAPPPAPAPSRARALAPPSAPASGFDAMDDDIPF